MAEEPTTSATENGWQRPTDRVAVVSPEGQAGTIAREDVDYALATGYTLETPRDTERRAEAAMYADRPVATAALSAVDSATFGALEHLTDGKLQKMKAANPTASVVGSVAGILTPFGAGGLVAQAGKAASRKLVPKIAARAGEGVVSRAAAPVVSSVVEGSLYGGASGAVDVALSDDPITVERVFSSIGGGMLEGAKWGAVGGLAGAGIGELATAGRAGVGKLREGIAKRAAAADAATAPPSITDDVLKTVAAKPPPRVVGVDDAVRAERKAVKGALDAERGAVAEAKAAASKSVGEGDEAVNAWTKARAEAGEKFRGGMENVDTWSRQALRRAEKVGDKFDDAQRAELTAAREEMLAARQASKEALGFDAVESVQVGKRGKELAKKGPKAYQWSRADDEMVDLIAAPDSPAAAAVRRQEAALERLRYAIDGKTMPRANIVDEAAGVMNAPKPDVDAMRAQAAAKVDTAKLTELETRLADLDRMVSPEAKAAAKVNHARQVIETAERTGMKATDDAIEAAARAQGYDALEWAKLPADAQTLLKAQYYQHAAKAELAARKTATSAARAETRAAEAAGATKREIGGAILGAGVDWVLGGTLGPVISGLIGGKLGSMVKGQLFGGIKGVLNEKALKAADSAAKAVDKFLAAGQRASAYVPRTARAALSSSVLDPRATSSEKPKTASDAFRVRSRELAAAIADPQGTERAILANLGPAVAANPSLGDKLVTAARSRLAFLHERMPKDPAGVSSFGGREYRPSDAEVAKWARYVAAADDPMGALSDEMASGALSAETVETVKTLYPAMYADIKVQLVERAAELRDGLSWPQRLTLSTFFGVPVDSVVRPEMVASMQATFAPSEPDTGGKPGAPSAPKLNASRLTSTQQQQPTEAQRLSG